MYPVVMEKLLYALMVSSETPNYSGLVGWQCTFSLIQPSFKDFKNTFYWLWIMKA